jgi:putative tryptophan/tyrosine transport system substrate-binding protein
VKKVFLILLAMVVALSMAPIGCTEPTDGVEEPLKIGIFQIVIHPALDAAREGFKDALTDAGLVEGVDVVYIEQEAAGEYSNAVTIADFFVGEGVDLICAIATPCVQAAATAVQGTTIPVVFTAVTEPKEAGVVDSWDVPGGQVTGVSDIAPVEPQLQLILDIFEDNDLELETLGVMYNPGEVNSVVQVDMQLPQAMTALALDITVVKSPATETAGVLAAAQALVGAVDAIWVPTDNTVVAAFEAVVGVAEEHDIPLFASDVATIERGAIGCWGMDYYVHGRVAGEMAFEILLEGANPAVMPVRTTPADMLYLNTAAAERMGVTIPQWLIDMADEVVEV